MTDKKTLSMSDIAKLARVPESTVSRALRDNPLVNWVYAEEKWTPLIGQRGSVLKVEPDIIIMLPVRAEKHPRAGKGTQTQGEGAGRGGRLAGSAKKSPGHLGRKRGRLIVPEDRQMAIDLIEEAIAAGARRCTACAVLAIDVRTLQRWKKALQEEHKLQDQRKAAAAERVPANKLSDEEREAILRVCKRPEYQSLPPSQIVPRLADQGEYLASEASFYRLLREADQLHRRGKAKAPRTVAKPEVFQATGPNQVWSWDITFLASIIRGAFYRLYLVLDIFSRKIVAWEVHDNESADHASVLIHKACLAAGIHQDGLVLHADNGGPMKGATILATLQKLGVVPSFSRPSVSDDNPYSESLFRTLKYAPAYPSKPFETIEAARKWVHSFVQWYNDEHCHSAIRYVTPIQRHRGEDHGLLKLRAAVYEAGRQRNPQRWSGKTRNWNPVTEVWLNPAKENQAEKGQNLKAA